MVLFWGEINKKMDCCILIDLRSRRLNYNKYCGIRGYEKFVKVLDAFENMLIL